jgi:hypothetical protein
MVDYSILRSLHPNKSIFRDTADSLGKEAMNNEEAPGEDFLAMMPAKIHAFDFTTKAWSKQRGF